MKENDREQELSAKKVSKKITKAGRPRATKEANIKVNDVEQLIIIGK